MLVRAGDSDRQGAIKYYYDTGRHGRSGFIGGQQVIIPGCAGITRRRRALFCHEHLDHRGALRSLPAGLAASRDRSPLGWQDICPVFAGEQWQWQGLTFQAHWPLRESADRGNNRSCVKADDGVHSIPLTGDIEAAL